MSYKIARTAYLDYVKKYKAMLRHYGRDNIGRMLYFEEFMEEYRARRIYERHRTGRGKKKATSRIIEEMTQEQIRTTKSQGNSAADNFNKKMEEIDAKIKDGKEVSNYQRRIHADWVIKFRKRKMTADDIRRKSKFYQDIYDASKEYGMGDEAFGS